MKQFSVLFLFVLSSVAAYAQEKSSIPEKKDPPPAGAATIAPEEVRMRALEEQVRTLAEEVALLRGELKTIRDTRPADPTTGSHLLLASSLKHRLMAALPPTPSSSIRTSA